MRFGTLKHWLTHGWPVNRYICYRLPTSAGNTVALTFDDGPHPVYTPQVLDILKDAGTKGVFFLLGNACRQYPELVRRIAAEGHTIGIHGMDHGTRDLVRQVQDCRGLLLALGVDTRLFRPPRGQLPAGTFLKLAVRGYRTMIWSFDSHDSMRHEGQWRGPAPDYRKLNACDIVLMHDDSPVCVRELPEVLDVLKPGRALSSRA